MAKFKEMCVVVLDVGMAGLSFASQSLQVLLHSKMVHRTKHELSLVLFGTDGTANELHDSFYRNNQPGQYMNVTVAHSLGLPTMDYLHTLHKLSPGDGVADALDAVVVGLEILKKAVHGDSTRMKIQKRIIVMSSFHTTPKEGSFPDRSFFSLLEGAPFHIQVIAVDADSASPSTTRDANLQGMRQFFSAFKDSSTYEERRVMNPADLVGVFPAKEHGPSSTLFAGPLSFGQYLDIPVKISIKSKRETFPTLEKIATGLHVKEEGAGTPYADSGPDMVREWYHEDDDQKQHPVPEACLVKGFRYGKESVPMSEENIEAASYRPMRGVHIIGFTDADHIPRHYLMREALVLVADKSLAAAQTALSSIIIAMHRRSQVAIVRAVLHAAHPKVQVLVAYPVLSTSDSPCHLILNDLPFQEDVRPFSFASFYRNNAEYISPEQAKAAHDLVAAMMTDEAQLAPQHVANPTLGRFVRFFCNRAIDPEYQVPGDDPFLQRVASPHVTDGDGERERAAASAARAMAELFPTGPGSKGEGRAVRRLRPGCERDDFMTMMRQENHEDAVVAMRKYIETLVDQSVGDSMYGMAVQNLELLRKESVVHRVPGLFNNSLRYLCTRFRDNLVKGEFWREVGEAGITLITNDDVDAPGAVTNEQADDFLA